MGTTPYTIRLDEGLRRALEREAELEERPAAQLAVRAIQTMIDAKNAKRRAIDLALEEAEKGAFVSETALNAWIDSWESEDELPIPKADILPPGA